MKQNCLKCNNCIHESVCHFWVHENYPSDFYENCTQYQEERPKGHWELFEKRPCQNLYMCSNCGHLIESMPDRLVENFKGCYCGADMRGGENV